MQMPPIPSTYRKWVIAKPLVNNTFQRDQFEMRELPIPELEEGQALVRVRLINLHSRTRLRMPTPEVTNGIGMAQLGDTDLTNYGCVEVVASKDKTFRVGDMLHCQVGWQEYQVISSDDGPIGYPPPDPILRAVNGSNASMNYAFRPELVESWPLDVLMDIFGTSGTTAYFGMRECGPIMPCDRVLVAGTSGSVGSLAAQLAKARGAYVVGLAGGEERCKWVVDTIGIDACIDYRATNLEERLRKAFPEGIDVFSDGIGGDLTALALKLMNRDGRMFAYGSSAMFYADRPEFGPMRGLRYAFGVTDDIDAVAREKNIKIECWIVYEFYHERITAENEMSRLMRDGKLKGLTNLTEGFENLPEAVMGMYTKPRAGKAQVRFEPPPQ